MKMLKENKIIVIEPRIEIFSRSKRPGWDVWGNKAVSDINLDKWEIRGGVYVPKS